MKEHNISLNDAVRRFLLDDEPDAPAPPSTGWLEGPALHEYEAHVKGTKPFTPEQLAWVRSHPSCQRTLDMFEQQFAGELVLAPGLPPNVHSRCEWKAEQGRGRVHLDFPRPAIKGTLVFLQRAGKGLARIARVDAEGRAEFTDLIGGAYRVVNPVMSGVLLAFSTGSDFAPKENETPQASSFEVNRDLGEGLHVRVNMSVAGAEIVFNTENPELAESSVCFAFCERDTLRVRLSGEVRLGRNKSAGGWTGSWRIADVPTAGVGDIIFSVEK